MRKYRSILFSTLFYSYIILFFMLGIIMILFELEYLPTNIENRIILFIQDNYYSNIRRLLFLVPLSTTIGLYYGTLKISRRL